LWNRLVFVGQTFLSACVFSGFSGRQECLPHKNGAAPTNLTSSSQASPGAAEPQTNKSNHDNLARPSRKQRNRITKTQKLETTKENSCESFGVFAISCFRDGFGFFAGREEIER